MTEQNATVEALLNQTRLINAIIGTQPTCKDFLSYLCAQNLAHDEKSLMERYKKIDKYDLLSIVPNEPKILEKIIQPITFAKGSYMIGNYLGTIALCGMVSEMLAMLVFEISDATLQGTIMTEKDQENLFGRKFEKLGQERRVEILYVLKLIDEETFKNLNEIKAVRNKYLHLYSQEHEDLPNDALKVFEKTNQVIVKALELGVRDGRVTIRQTLLNYLIKHGFAKKQT